MRLDHRSATDLLEPFALGALPADTAADVADHLRECDGCAAAAADLAEVVGAIPESLAPLEPTPVLRERILAAARARSAPGGAPDPARGSIWSPLARGVRAAAIPAAAILVVAISIASVVESRRELAAVRAERNEYLSVLERVSQGGRWWYMAGAEEFAGSGGSLIAGRDGAAFVLFHDLRPLEPGERYTVWLIRPDGGWVRGSNFNPSGRRLEQVDLALHIENFVQCAVTVETAETGRRSGPLVMQSRVFAP